MDDVVAGLFLDELRAIREYLGVLAAESQERTKLLRESVSLQTDSTTSSLQTNTALMQCLRKDEDELEAANPPVVEKIRDQSE